MNKTHFGIAAASAAAAYLWWGNRAIATTEYRITSPFLPAAFNGYRIAHISDLHNTRFGARHRNLLQALRSARPDLIAITGDMIDARRTDISCALEFAEQAVSIAPCVYVMGNHEARIPSYPKFEEGLRSAGVQVLRNALYPITRGGTSISVIGIDDPSVSDTFTETLFELRNASQGFTVLLCHRPERFDTYCSAEFHLALCGHAHGGQVRLPFIGGIIAPHQGFFPAFDAGQYVRNNTTMVLSRGLGNSLCPLRINNRPELVLIELNSKSL